MSKRPSTCEAALRVSDVAPLRHVLGSHSIVFRIDAHGGIAPLERMPALFFSSAIRTILDGGLSDDFQDLCRVTAATCRPATYRAHHDRADEVLLYPVLSDHSDECQFLICWARSASEFVGRDQAWPWSDLRADEIVVRYRRRTSSTEDLTACVIDATSWWQPGPGELIPLSGHHEYVAAMGMAHDVFQTLLLEAFADAAECAHGPAVRVSIPSAELLAVSVPIFHGALSATGIEPTRVFAAVPVELAADPDLLPIIVHLRTMGVRIDIVGLDSLTSTLHLVSDTAGPSPSAVGGSEPVVGRWMGSYAEAATSTRSQANA